MFGDYTPRSSRWVLQMKTPTSRASSQGSAVVERVFFDQELSEEK